MTRSPPFTPFRAMTSLRRLLKSSFLNDYLAEACQALELQCAAVVSVEGRTLAARGDGGQTLRRDDPDAFTLSLRAGGRDAGHLILRALPSCEGGHERTGSETLRQKADFLGRSLQAMIDTEAARRAVTAEALDVYRELSLLRRATVDLNQSLEQANVADTLLKEFRQGANPADHGVVFVREPRSECFTVLSSSGPDAENLGNIAGSLLFKEIVEARRGEIVNDLAADSRWHDEAPGLAAILIIPLAAYDRCAGVLVLATRDADTEFSAAHLKQTSALASVAAAALGNARLFEEVLEAKTYNETVLENLSNGVITLDRSLRITQTNGAAQRILRREDSDLVGQPVSAVFTRANDWVVESLVKTTEAETGDVWLDREIQLHEGGRVSVNLTVAPLFNVECKTVGHMLVLEDITREKRIKGTMGRFMSDAVVEKLLDLGDSLLGGTSQEVTVLFCDIRDFTSLSEKLSAREMVLTLNEYFTQMVDVIFQRGGTLDKFIGDGIMAVFGAPFRSSDDPENAVATAVDMMIRLRGFNIGRSTERRPPLNIGIGIDTGTVVAGTIGSPKRMDYTVIGDHVNLASRIESANKYYGTNI